MAGREREGEREVEVEGMGRRCGGAGGRCRGWMWWSLRMTIGGGSFLNTILQSSHQCYKYFQAVYYIVVKECLIYMGIQLFCPPVDKEQMYCKRLQVDRC